MSFFFSAEDESSCSKSLTWLVQGCFDFCADKVLVLLRLRFKLLKAFAALRDLLELETGF